MLLRWQPGLTLWLPRGPKWRWFQFRWVRGTRCWSCRPGQTRMVLGRRRKELWQKFKHEIMISHKIEKVSDQKTAKCLGIPPERPFQSFIRNLQNNSNKNTCFTCILSIWIGCRFPIAAWEITTKAPFPGLSILLLLSRRAGHVGLDVRHDDLAQGWSDNEEKNY